ncbi:DUF397 domain-containing protein [Winogradskya humida]|uniref:DUF397 domain-containing protein n=1 Tax=Winogradskya humida TaxID=113566 RepID=A0ABQ4A1Q6_9ACTN|nr:DUF397 domain-containing protein [Actinoplanes humidus]GIE24784.1 hypothetical protein Ahu01nite_078860 [Actinoplanes humidus]
MSDAPDPQTANVDDELTVAARHPQVGRWFKSSDSGGDSDCVEVRYREDGGVEVRHSKDRSGPTLTFTASEFKAFVGGAKKGEFDS